MTKATDHGGTLHGLCGRGVDAMNVELRCWIFFPEFMGLNGIEYDRSLYYWDLSNETCLCYHEKHLDECHGSDEPGVPGGP